MKFPWFSSENSSEKNNELIQENKKEETKKTYEINSLPKDLQKIAMLIQHTDKEIIYLKKKLEATSTARKALEQKLAKEVNSLNL